MVLACCRGRTRRRGPDPTVVTPHDNLDIREGARVDAHDIRVLTVGIRATMRHERRGDGMSVLYLGFTVVQNCTLADAEQREPGYLSWVEIDTRINGLRVRRARLAFLRLSQQGSRVAKGSKGVRGILGEPMP